MRVRSITKSLTYTLVVIFFFKQKTAYEIRKGDWSSDVCSSDLNIVLDVWGLSILNPVELETAVNNIAGVVTNGLFSRRGADVLLLGTRTGVRTIARK